MEVGSIGCAAYEAAESGVEGKITAVFERSVHLGSGNMVITLGGLDMPNHPFNIRTPGLPRSLRSGQEFGLAAGTLSLSDAHTLDISGYEVFRPAVRVDKMAAKADMIQVLQDARMVVATTSFREGLTSFVMGGPMHGMITQAVLPLIQRMGNALREGDWGTMASTGVELAGVGEGLTPSGDDFLVGLVAALHFYRASGGGGPENHHLRTLATEAAERTSPFSAQNIAAAAQGLVADVVADWLTFLHLGDSEGVKNSTRALLSYGHSSGVDTFAGMMTALSSVLDKG